MNRTLLVCGRRATVAGDLNPKTWPEGRLIVVAYATRGFIVVFIVPGMHDVDPSTAYGHSVSPAEPMTSKAVFWFSCI